MSPERNNGEEPRVVVRDRRKIDPETGELRRQPGGPGTAEQAQEVPAAETAGPPAGESAVGAGPRQGVGVNTVDGSVEPVSELEKELAERTSDLQRVQAEYANYRRRVERDREAVIVAAKASVASELLSLLDDIDRAEQHGDLTGPFKAVADKLAAGLQRAGLESFGAEGEPFDPSVHEAVQHSTSPEVNAPTVTTVLRRGYKFGDRVLRAAMVSVTDHEPGAEPAEGVGPRQGVGSNAAEEPTVVEQPVEQSAESADEQN